MKMPLLAAAIAIFTGLCLVWLCVVWVRLSIVVYRVAHPEKARPLMVGVTYVGSFVVLMWVMAGACVLVSIEGARLPQAAGTLFFIVGFYMFTAAFLPTIQWTRHEALFYKKETTA